MSEVSQPAPGKIAASYALGMCAIGLIALLWMRGLLRPALPILLIVAVVLILRRVLKALRAPPPRD